MTKELDPDWPVFEKTADDDDESAQEIILDVRFPSDAPIKDRDGREYEFVGKFLADNDFYQGLNMVSVIKRVSDGKLFGYFWWDDISKHGESFIEENGAGFGLEVDYSGDDFDFDTDWISYYVWTPVKESTIKIYMEDA